MKYNISIFKNVTKLSTEHFENIPFYVDIYKHVIPGTSLNFLVPWDLSRTLWKGITQFPEIIENKVIVNILFGTNFKHVIQVTSPLSQYRG